MGAGSIGFTIKMFLIDNINAAGVGDADVSVIGIISTLTTAFLAALLKFQNGADKISKVQVEQSKTQNEQLKLLEEIAKSNSEAAKRDESQLELLKDMNKRDEELLETQIKMLDSQKAHIKVQNELTQAYLEGQRLEPKKRKNFLAEKLKEILDD